MKKRSRLLVTGAVLGFGAVLVASASPATEPPGDWMAVTGVMVNRLGGVNVSGQVSCAGAYASLVDGDLMYEVGDGSWDGIPYDEDMDVILSANSDNYTVSQPAGRKTMIQVTHESSRLTPCYSTVTTFDDVTTVPCDSSGTPCRWETDAFGYERDELGPLFDYSPDGKFKSGLLSVTSRSVGLLVQTRATDVETWEYYWVPEGSYAMFSGTIRAVSYR